MTQNMTYAKAIDQAIDAVMHHCANDVTKSAVIKRLNALKNFELNMGVLSVAMCNIRADAIQAKYAIKDGKATTENVLKTINQIEKTADSLHNVGGFMASGIACDAAYLLHHGVDHQWPTGMEQSSTAKFSPPNTAAILQEYTNKFELNSEERENLRHAMHTTSRFKFPN